MRGSAIALSCWTTSIVQAFLSVSRANWGASEHGAIQRVFAGAMEEQSYSSRAQYDHSCDVLVIGGGPAGLAMASVLTSATLDVIVADSHVDQEWIPNYGVWKDEWDAVFDRYRSLGIEFNGGRASRSLDRQWQVTDCYLGGSYGEAVDKRTRLRRPYCRIDNTALKRSLNNGFRNLKASHFSQVVSQNVYLPAGSVMFDDEGTTIQLQSADSTARQVMTVRTRVVVDATGHESSLTMEDVFGSPSECGYQVGYGIAVEIGEARSINKSKIGPYCKEAMTLFDYRSDHLVNEKNLARGLEMPTFMYVMPLAENQVFFEETSLLARPTMSLQECRKRCYDRLKYHGLQVTKVIDEEFCCIPMGGPLPARGQRILAIGGAGAMVHPATGYQLCRGLMGAAEAAQVIAGELNSYYSDVHWAVASAYHTLWSPSNIRQRNFAVFVAEFLLSLNLQQLRGFFQAFFSMPQPMWAG